MKLYLTRYTNRLPSYQLGNARLFLITLRNDQKGNDHVLAHEVEHVKQWYMMFAPLIAVAMFMLYFSADLMAVNAGYVLLGLSIALHPLLYQYNRQYRLFCEVKAYKAQINAGYEVHLAVRSLMHSSYRFNLHRQDALKLLTGKSA